MNKPAQNILLVDDVADNLQVLSEILTREGYRVRPVTSGQTALRTIDTSLPDLILLDIKMPQMDGYELCRLLKSSEKTRDIPVIFISALGETKDKVRGFELGAVDYITKPFQASEVVARVRTHLTMGEMRLALQRMNQELEQRVQERTRELAEANRQLQLEVIERKKAEQESRRKAEELDAIFTLSLDLLSIADMEGRFIRLNPAWEKALGYSAQELTGRPFIEFVHPDDIEATRTATAQLASGQPVIDFINRYRCRDGSYRWIEWRATPHADKFIHAAARDITERKNAEEALRQSELQLRQAQKMDAIGQLAGGVAHDFNNQLGGILGYVELLLDDLADPQLRTFAQKIRDITLRAADLTNRLLAFARKGKYTSAPVDLHATISQVVSLLSRSIDKRITIKQFLLAPRPVTIGDANQLQNALLNLALNARDAMPNGGDLIFSSAVIDVVERAEKLSVPLGRYIEISITDSGIGIAPEHQQHIFEPFFTTKEPGKGTGLGLASVFGTIKNHQGGILFYSEPGHGTTFKIYLPQMCDDAAIQGEHPKPSPVRGAANILVADDEEALRDTTKRMLKSLGYTVTTCADGQEAVNLYRDIGRSFDLIILDMIMPRMGGLEAYLQLRRINPEVKVLLSSGYSVNGEAQSILDKGVLGFLHKPFQASELSEIVAKVLQHKE